MSAHPGLIALAWPTRQLGWVRMTGEKDEIILVTQNGRALRFNVESVRPMGRQGAGVAGIKLADDDRVWTSMCVIEKGGDLLVVTEFGFGKRTAVDEYPAKGTCDRRHCDDRYSQPGENWKNCRAARVVQEDDEVTFMSTGGIVLRVKGCRIFPAAGDPPGGCISWTLGENDRVATVAVLASNDLRKVGVEANGNGADQLNHLQ